MWVNNINNFNNLSNALLVLFQIMTIEGWTNVLNIASDSTYPNYISMHFGNENVAIVRFIFLAWIVIGNFLVLNLFVGVIIDNFNVIKEKNSGVSMFRKEQKTWVEIQRLFLKKMPQKLIIPPEDPIRNWC